MPNYAGYTWAPLTFPLATTAKATKQLDEAVSSDAAPGSALLGQAAHNLQQIAKVHATTTTIALFRSPPVASSPALDERHDAVEEGRVQPLLLGMLAQLLPPAVRNHRHDVLQAKLLLACKQKG